MIHGSHGIEFPEFRFHPDMDSRGADIDITLLTCSRCYALVSMHHEHAAWHTHGTDHDPSCASCPPRTPWLAR